jgi:hypothetical protein
MHLEIQDNDETSEEQKDSQNRGIKSEILLLKKRQESNQKSRGQTNSTLRVELSSEEDEVRTMTAEEMLYLSTFEVDDRVFINQFLRD